jgi:DNA-directed RNA polymerase subunit RPC12/RpoP
MIIEGNLDGIYAEFGKRTYLDGITLKFKCPHCSQELTVNEPCLTYATTNTTHEIGGYCADCNKDVKIAKVRLRVSAELVDIEDQS